MANTSALIKKLQTALKQKDLIYCVNNSQFYSESIKTMCTKYTVVHWYRDEEGEKQRDNFYFNKQMNVLLFLANVLKASDST